MGKMFVVFKREYLERVRSKWFLIATFLGPVFMGLITVLPIVLAARTRTSDTLADIVVIDATGTDLGSRVVKSLTASTPLSPAPRLRVVAPDQVDSAVERATREVMRRESQGYLVLDASTIGGRSVQYAGRNASSLGDVQSLATTVRQSLLNQRLEREGIDPGRVAVLTAVKLDTKTEKITDKGRAGEGGMTSFFFGYAIAFVLYFMIALYGQNILRGVMEEKTTRVAEVVISSVKPEALLAGKIFGVGLVAVTQVLIWAIVSVFMYQARAQILVKFGVPVEAAMAIKIPGVSPAVGIALLLFFVLGFIFYASLFAAVGAMVSSQEDVQQAAMPVTLLLVSSIIFMQPVLLNPASMMAKVMSRLPFSAPIIMPLRMSLISISWLEITATLAGVVLGCWAATWVSARIYRVGLLMYGKRPSFAELARWVRTA